MFRHALRAADYTPGTISPVFAGDGCSRDLVDVLDTLHTTSLDSIDYAVTKSGLHSAPRLRISFPKSVPSSPLHTSHHTRHAATQRHSHLVCPDQPFITSHHIQLHLLSNSPPLAPQTDWKPAPPIPFSTAVSGSVQLTGLWIRSAQRK